MKFGETLRNSVREEWKDKYIDYGKLKKLLREKDREPSNWSEEDESNFVEELVNVQIEKVNSFHIKIGNDLKDRVSACETKLEPLAQAVDSKGDGNLSEETLERNKKTINEVHEELDSISKEIASLYKFARLNFTACLKAAKKHDRLKQYKIRPLVQVRLSSLPFSSEDYSPLLYKISGLYAFIRQYGQNEESAATTKQKSSTKTYESHKFWVHPDNLLEVKTYILRRLPVLIYNPQSSKVAKANRKDPQLTSLYFDNAQFDLYSHKLDRYENAASLRLRWYGPLADRPELYLERKIVPSVEEAEETGTEERIALKEKEIQSFISGDSNAVLDKKIQKAKERKGDDEAEKYERTARNIHTFVKDNHLQPILRAVYTRTAFQIPGEDEIRVSLDTDLCFIKEDALGFDKSARPADDWHRHDIDDRKMEYPFKALPKDEISKFPFALLEIKIVNSLNARAREWVSDLMNSHLVHESPRFSKFVHGVSVLFEDNVNSFPFWMGDLDKDIRKDPKDAWEQEQDKIKRQAEDEFAVGSLAMGASPMRGSPFRAVLSRETGGPSDSSMRRRLSVIRNVDYDSRPSNAGQEIPVPEVDEEQEGESDDDTTSISRPKPRIFGGLNAWALRKKARPSVRLPPGVHKPEVYLKDAGPLQVEAKVWLANQRTFIKWQHICVLLASLSLGLFNAAGKHNNAARGIGIFFTGIAVFSGAWGYWMYMRRSKLITERTEKGFDSMTVLIGPLIVCVTMILALTLNFLFKFKIAFTETFYLQDLTDVVYTENDTSLLIQGGSLQNVFN